MNHGLTDRKESKLDGVGPVDKDSPQTSFSNLTKKEEEKKKKKNMSHVTCDT